MSWRERILHNPGLKLASLGLACLLWYAVHGRHDPSAALPDPKPGPLAVKDYVNLPITILQSATAAQRFRVQPHQVSIRVSGDQSILQELRGSDLEVFVNLADIGDRPQTARRVKILAPAGVRVLRVEPALVHIERLPPATPAPTQPSPAP